MCFSESLILSQYKLFIYHLDHGYWFISSKKLPALLMDEYSMKPSLGIKFLRHKSEGHAIGKICSECFQRVDEKDQWKEITGRLILTSLKGKIQPEAEYARMNGLPREVGSPLSLKRVEIHRLKTRQKRVSVSMHSWLWEMMFYVLLT